VPTGLYQSCVMILLLAIGLKGGVALQSQAIGDILPKAAAAGPHPAVLFVSGVAGELVRLQIGVALGENLLDHEFRDGAQDGKLLYPPAFSGKIARKSLIEKAALIVQAVVVRNALVMQAAGGVILVPNDKPADTALFHQRQDAHQEDRNGPQANGIIIGAHGGKILPDEGQVPQHPGEEAVGVHPHFGRIGLHRLLVAIPIDRREPVAAALVPENGVYILTQLFEQRIAQQAVLTATGQHAVRI
ncbi:MAG: sodium-dependent bicarbonate transport family permease, partial [Phaeodactylibacter sp.]|nr:sodium-dependent bicarbonate transport family permease [Phaeodactylibacter sp.]